MKRTVAMVLTLCFLLGVIINVSAETIKVPIDISAMETNDLKALDSLIHQELALRGEISSDDKGVNNEQEEIIPDQTDDDIDTMNEGETELSDESFLRDLSSALVARWAIPNQDTSIMSNKQMVEYYSMLVNSELAYVSKYSEYTFVDEHLGEYARAYINALNSQFIAVTEYAGKDDNLYDQYWSDGYSNRGRYIYLINKEYGLDIPSEYTPILSEMVQVGILFNYLIPMESAVSTECAGLELDFDTTSSKSYLYVKPFNFKNTSPYDFTDLTVKINFIDSNDVVVDSGYLISYEAVGAGKSISTKKVSTDEHFARVSYTYSFNVQTSAYYQPCEGTIEPSIQYSWDGKIKKNGELTTGQAMLEIKNIVSGWEMNTSWSKTLYIPALKFDVVNTGTGDAENITVRVVFTNQSTKEIWDEETTYVVGSSDTPLRAGYSKKAFVYSSVGYKTKVTPPELTADIYLNNELVQSITISK